MRLSGRIELVTSAGKVVGYAPHVVIDAISPGAAVAPAISATLDMTLEDFGGTREARRDIRRTMRAFKAMAPRRRETLRHQARRKGKPGWKAIRIPSAPKYELVFTPNDCTRSP